jgi:hypothetical protein
MSKYNHRTGSRGYGNVGIGTTGGNVGVGSTAPHPSPTPPQEDTNVGIGTSGAPNDSSGPIISDERDQEAFDRGVDRHDK